MSPDPKTTAIHPPLGPSAMAPPGQGDGTSVGQGGGAPAGQDTVSGWDPGPGLGTEPELGLTVLFHPMLRRIGEIGALPGFRAAGGAELSRLSPNFCAPGDVRGRPLNDPGISRRPVRLDRRPGGIRISPPDGGRLMVGRREIAGPVEVSDALLARGVIIETSRRVALLLHALPPRGSSHRGPAPLGPECGLLGHSAAVVRLRADVKKVADVDVPVLLLGPTGTGKELSAQAIHRASRRAAGPFVAVNVGAIPPSVAASELFGHTRGAFTGATSGRPGLFRQAHHGTLFLDEIGDAPPAIQVALLRALETGEITPVGASEPVRVDVRVIAATDIDLGRAVATGGFRAALLERLGGFRIQLPTLAERVDDIARLFCHFLNLELARVGASELLELPSPTATPWISADIVARLCAFSWPGNVRQLLNVVRQLVISNRWSTECRVDSVVEAILEGPPDPPVPPASSAQGAPLWAPKRPSRLNDDEVRRALLAAGFRYREAAKHLGISRTSLLKFIDNSAVLRRPKEIQAEEIRAGLVQHDGDLVALAAAFLVSERGLKLRMRELGL